MRIDSLNSYSGNESGSGYATAKSYLALTTLPCGSMFISLPARRWFTLLRLRLSISPTCEHFLLDGHEQYIEYHEKHLELKPYVQNDFLKRNLDLIEWSNYNRVHVSRCDSVAI